MTIRTIKHINTKNTQIFDTLNNLGHPHKSWVENILKNTVLFQLNHQQIKTT